MSEIKLSQVILEPTTEEPTTPESNDIRVLDDLELALTGGGDTIIPWP